MKTFFITLISDRKIAVPTRTFYSFLNEKNRRVKKKTSCDGSYNHPLLSENQRYYFKRRQHDYSLAVF